MRFRRMNRDKLEIGVDEMISPSYVTMVQNNAYKEIKISRSDCKKSVRMLSLVPKKKN